MAPYISEFNKCYVLLFKKNLLYISFCNKCRTCVVTPSAGLWCVAVASQAVQTQHISSAPWPVSTAVLDVSIILQGAIQVRLLQNQGLSENHESALYLPGT